MESLEYDSYTDSYWYEDMESGEWIEVTHEELEHDKVTWI